MDAAVGEREKRGAVKGFLHVNPRSGIYKRFKPSNPNLTLRMVWLAEWTLADLQNELFLLFMKSGVNTTPYGPSDILNT